MSVLFVLPFAFTAFASDAGSVLASGSVRPVIVLPDDPTAPQQNAAQVLERYLRQITGFGDTAAPADCRIVLDDDSVQPPSDKDGAYRILERDGDIYLSGAGTHGTLYAAYALLEAFADCHWYADTLEVIPASERVTAPHGCDIRYTPFFEYRETDWRSWKNRDYAAANRMNGSAYRSVPAGWGGSVVYLSGFAHTLTNQFCASGSYFETHPEYFALHGKARTPNQLCLTNPDVLRIVTAEVLDMLRRTYDPSLPLQIVSLTQHDNGDYCECDACAALDKANGSHAGTMVTFANAVADAVREAGYENAAIDTFAYQYTRKPPTQVRPRDNVIIRLCSIECCFGHTMDDPACRQNASFMEDLAGWSKICDRIYVWDYGTNYGETFNFFPNLHVLQRNMQIFYENHVRGVYGEGNYYTDLCEGEFSDLRSYLQCRLMADPYLDYDAEMNGFLEAYYGDGWQEIREFIDLCCDKGVSAISHAGIYQRANRSLPKLTGRDVTRCDTLWQTAKEKAQDDTYRARVERSELCWRYWKASNFRKEFSIFRSPFRRMQARDALYNDIVAFGNTSIGEMTRKRGLSACPALHLLRTPFCWSTLYDDAFWDWLSPYVEKVYDAWMQRQKQSFVH